MTAFSGPILGSSRSAFLRSGGIALPSACRIIRRCTPCFRAKPSIVSPAAYSRRIVSNNSSLALLCILPACQNMPVRVFKGGPNQTIEVGQIRVAKSVKLACTERLDEAHPETLPVARVLQGMSDIRDKAVGTAFSYVEGFREGRSVWFMKLYGDFFWVALVGNTVMDYDRSTPPPSVSSGLQ